MAILRRDADFSLMWIGSALQTMLKPFVNAAPLARTYPPRRKMRSSFPHADLTDIPEAVQLPFATVPEFQDRKLSGHGKFLTFQLG